LKPITQRELHFFDNRIDRATTYQKGLHLNTILKKISFKRFEALYREGYIRAVAVNHFDHNDGIKHKGTGKAGRLNVIAEYCKSSKHNIIGTQQSKWALQNCR